MWLGGVSAATGVGSQVGGVPVVPDTAERGHVYLDVRGSGGELLPGLPKPSYWRDPHFYCKSCRRYSIQGVRDVEQMCLFCWASNLAHEQPECHSISCVGKLMKDIMCARAGEEEKSPWMRPTQRTAGKFTKALSSATQMQGAQHLQGHKFYLLPVSLSLSYLYSWSYSVILKQLFC